ncbi:MAG TPA: hypothetical protein DDW28_09320 [Prevotella sp.]|nr:hypothetical protein [uncultured Prevotella sp.]HBF06262.1 hypothetical protein [Candidatus Segatella violae]
MKKAIVYTIGILLVLFLMGAILWAFLGEVEDGGRVYALLSVLEIVLWGVCAILLLVVSIAYWGGIAKLIDKYIKNAPKWLYWLVFIIYAVVGIWMECKLCNIGDYMEKQYKIYQYQKKFEYKYNVDL